MTKVIMVPMPLLLLIASTVVSALAQETPTPDPTSASVLLLPEASAFGPGWVQTKALAVEQLNWGVTMAPDVFRQGAAGIYGGPSGARVVVVTLLLTESRVTIRRGWENATQLFNSFSYQLSYDSNHAALWEALPAVEGCAEARRFEGESRDFGFPTGVTLCAADPDLIVVALASGLVNDRTGYAASDAVVRAVLAGRG
jgi:hypothetical protein